MTLQKAAELIKDYLDSILPSHFTDLDDAIALSLPLIQAAAKLEKRGRQWVNDSFTRP